MRASRLEIIRYDIAHCFGVHLAQPGIEHENFIGPDCETSGNHLRCRYIGEYIDYYDLEKQAWLDDQALKGGEHSITTRFMVVVFSASVTKIFCFLSVLSSVKFHITATSV